MKTDNRVDEPASGSSFGGTFSDEFDWSDIEPSTAVVEMVMTAAECGPTETEPLYGTVDPDALDALVGGSGSTSAGDVTVEFSFNSHEVAVSSDGTVTIRALQTGV
jgi:hypothetical protein